jgi:multiple antibiotic resistance protein
LHEFVLPVLNALIALPLTLLPIIDPLSTAPVFVATAGRSQAVVERLARQVAINSWIVIVVSMVLGTQVLALFGISLPVVRMGGGLLLASTGWQMLHHNEQDDVHVAAANQAQVLSETEIVRRSFFPITFPLTTGPGVIATAIALGTQLPRSLMLYLAGVGVAMAGAALTAWVLYFTFKHAGTLLDRLGEIGTLVMMRLFAFLLLCIGIQFMFTGWTEFFLEP